ncbi:MerR family transcriptional regulator [Azospirillum sp. B4]|uniref:MerR family transcriptional regulator n=1 Tax=Azospirillum sp. B4 TaxID=95605 RepID=UPI00034BD90E|nr:MerR family transcriptional regulator [Azospirillum sp. B4]
MSGTPAPDPQIPAEDVPDDGSEAGGDAGLELTEGGDAPGAGGTSGAAASERGRGKSPTAFRTISEVSAELDVPQHVLRFWETKFPHIRPLKRGGGRRYYRPDDVELLRRIQVLLYKEGYTIKGVQRLLRTSGGRVPAPGPGMAGPEEAVDDSWVEEAAEEFRPPSTPQAQPEEKRRIIGLFDHDPEADPEWARNPPPEPEPVATRPVEPRRPAGEKGLPAAKREALGQVLADLEEIRDLLRRVL